MCGPDKTRVMHFACKVSRLALVAFVLANYFAVTPYVWWMAWQEFNALEWSPGKWNSIEALEIGVDWMVHLSILSAVAGVAVIACRPQRGSTWFIAIGAFLLNVLCVVFHWPLID